VRILIAEDDDVSRLALEALLAKRGHEVLTAADGQEAWDILQQEGNRPALAILDWMMPELDGVQVCRRVRQDPSLRGVYVIMLTSRGDRRHQDEGIRAGANDYVTKPFVNEQLLARVNVAEERVRTWEGSAERDCDQEEPLTNTNAT
jgi:DNA-binding response OmpR family regulator